MSNKSVTNKSVCDNYYECLANLDEDDSLEGVEDAHAPPPKRAKPAAHNKFVVDVVLDKRVLNGQVQYLIHWKDLPRSSERWMSAAQCPCPEAITCYDLTHMSPENQPQLPTVQNRSMLEPMTYTQEGIMKG